MAAKISPHVGYTFDDVLLRPQRSSIEPREASLRAVLVPGITLEAPFLSAAMDRVTGAAMAIALHKAGGLGVLHRNCEIDAQVAMVKEAKAAGARVAAACGPFSIDRAAALSKAGVDALVLDCAHGHNLNVIKSAKAIRKKVGKLPLIIGNIATKEAVADLAGIADAVKVGVGPGSICTTRIVSGVGMPQLSAIIEVASAARKAGVKVIADGGMRTSGDVAKALAAGADAVMLGNMFAGTLETPGKVVQKNGEKFKEYRGMGSRAVLEEGRSSDRYLMKGRAIVPEGVDGLVPFKGPVANVVATLVSSVQVSMGYVGAKNLKEFGARAVFVPVTVATLQENRPHTLL